MKIKFHSSVLFTKNFNAMSVFYTDILQQEIEFDYGNCIGFTCGLSLWELKPEYTIAEKLGTCYHASGNKNIELCFETESFDEVIAQLQNNNISFLHQEIEEPWGQKTTRFYDPENNLIEIGETLSCFVNRFYKQGLEPEKIAERTSLPFEQVCTLIQR